MAPWECCGALEANSSQKISLQPYSDISGKGVLVAFLGSTYLALVLLIGNYLVAFDPTANPFATEPDGGAASNLGTPDSVPQSKADAAGWWRPNPVDCLFLGWVRRKKGPWHAAGKAFVKCIVDISDLQLLTGLAILITGFISLRCPSRDDAPPISAYHWQMVVNLAWFSTIMHLAALSVLRTHFRRHPRTRFLRFLLSLLLLALLLVAMWPTIFFNWRGGSAVDVSAANMSSNAICFYDYSYGVAEFDKAQAKLGKYSRLKLSETMAVQEVILSVTLLLGAFLNRTVKLFKTFSSLFTSSLRKRASKTFLNVSTKLLRSTYPSKSRPVRLALWRGFYLWPCVATFYWGRIVLDASSSALFEIIILLVSVLWGTLKLFDYRVIKDSDITLIAPEENKFTFGQVLPLLLLTTSAFSLSGSFLSELNSSPKSSPTDTETHNPGNGSTVTLSSQSSGHAALASTEEEWDLNAAMRNGNAYASTPWLGSCVLFLTLQMSVPTLELLALHNASLPRRDKHWMSNRPSQSYLAFQFFISFIEMFCILLVRLSFDKTATRSHKKPKRLITFNYLLVLTFFSKMAYVGYFAFGISTLDNGSIFTVYPGTAMASIIFSWIYGLYIIICFINALLGRQV